MPPDDAGEAGPDDAVPFEFTDELDLHPFHPRDVADLVRDYLEHASAQGWEHVRIIHGKGIGAVRETVHRVLASLPDVERHAAAGDGSGWGATIVTLRPAPVVLRRLAADDSMATLTGILNRAYAPLAARGMRFVASWRDEAITRRRCESGEAWVAEARGRLVGTLTFLHAAHTDGSPWYEREDVSSFGQWAVEPAWQGRGLGRRLLDIAERRARETGAAHLALDTSEHAVELIATYERHGFRFVEHAQWDSTNYRSVIMSKELG